MASNEINSDRATAKLNGGLTGRAGAGRPLTAKQLGLNGGISAGATGEGRAAAAQSADLTRINTTPGRRAGGLTTEAAAPTRNTTLETGPLTAPETSPTQLKLSNIRESIKKYGGPQKSNLFVVTIKNASKFLGPGFEERDLIYFCNRATLPGVGFATVNGFKRHGVGISELVPYDAMFTDTALTFLGDSDGFLLNFFERWGNKITSFYSAHDISSARPMIAKTNGWEPGEIGYKKDFQTDIVIELLNTSLLTVTKYTLHKAFPVVINGNSLSWGAQNTVMETDVSFTFQNWSSERYEDSTKQEASLPGMSFLQRVLQLGSLAATFGAIGVPNSVADVVQLVNATNIIGFNSRSLLR